MSVEYRIIAARREFIKIDRHRALGTVTKLGNIPADFLNAPFEDKIESRLTLFCIKRCRLQTGAREDDDSFVTRINSIVRR